VEPASLFQHHVAHDAGRKRLEMTHTLRDKPQPVSIVQQPIVRETSHGKSIDRRVAHHNPQLVG
jgi:hypothetical protein